MREHLDHTSTHALSSQFFNAGPRLGDYGPVQRIPSTGSGKPPVFVDYGAKPSPSEPLKHPSEHLQLPAGEKKSESLEKPERLRILEGVYAGVAILSLILGAWLAYLPGSSYAGFPKSYLYALLGLLAAGSALALFLVYTGRWTPF